MKNIIKTTLITLSLFTSSIANDFNFDKLIQEHKVKLGAKDIIVSVMESNTGKVLYLNNKDLAVNYIFEPISLLNPIITALALNNNLISKDEKFNIYNEGKKDKYGNFPEGSYSIDKFTIYDNTTIDKNYLTYDEGIYNSSRITSLQIAQRLSSSQIFNGLKDFGFTEKSGINVINEKIGVMPKIEQFALNEIEKKDNIFKATVSYGQGIVVNFMQILKAYNVFNNNGYILTPTLSLIQEPIQILNEKTTNDIRDVLIKKVENDYVKYKNSLAEFKIIEENHAKHLKETNSSKEVIGLKENDDEYLKIDNVDIGAMSGTTNITNKGVYTNKYVSSTFGFVNIKDKKYTIGITVLEPISTGKNWYYHYASHSSSPLFKDVVKSLMNK